MNGVKASTTASYHSNGGGNAAGTGVGDTSIDDSTAGAGAKNNVIWKS